MKFKKTLVWSCTTWQTHPSLDEKEQTIEGLMPLTEVLFPGVNYYSITGFGQLMRDCLVPVLKKLFPELQFLPAEDIKDGEMVEVAQFLPSKGYEWQDSSEWQADLQKLLVAA